MRKGDKLLIIAVLVFVAIGFVLKLYNDNRFKGTDSIATIEINGKVYGQYDLKKVGNKIIDLKLPGDEHSVVEFNNGSVRIKEAGCPDKVCVRTGWISKPGDMIVCLPYKIIVKISGERQDIDVNAF